MDPKRVLIVYYSRTGTTRTVARALADELGCTVERIADRKRRGGVLGYVRSSLDALLRRPVELRPMATNPADYDLVVVGTPIWNMSVSAPVRAYLAEHRAHFRRVAFFCTCGGSGDARVLRQMEEACGKAPVDTLALRANEVRRGSITARVRSFASALTSAPAPEGGARPTPLRVVPA